MSHTRQHPNVISPEEFVRYSHMNPVNTGFKFIGKGYAPGDGDKHTVSCMRRVIDTTDLMKIEDMGAGILIVEIPNFPENDISELKRRMELLLHDPSLFPDYNHPDLEVSKLRDTCLGKRDCFIGLYEYSRFGRARSKGYALVVKSYDTHSAMMHQRSVAKIFDDIREKTNGADQIRKKVEEIVSGKKYLETPFYTKIQQKSVDHRMKVAKYVFRKLGIALPCPESVLHSRRLRRAQTSGGASGSRDWRNSSSSSSSSDHPLPGRSTSDRCNSLVFPHTFLEPSVDDTAEHLSKRVFGTSYWNEPVDFKLTGEGIAGDDFSIGRTKTVSATGDAPINFGRLEFEYSEQSKKQDIQDYQQAVRQYFGLRVGGPGSIAPGESSGAGTTTAGEQSVWQDYPMVFLANGKQDTLLAFNHLYTKQDFVDGAPFQLQPWVGFYRHWVEPETKDVTVAQIQDLGCPVGIPTDRSIHDFGSTGDMFAEDLSYMRERVRWKSQIDLQYAICPTYYGTSRFVDGLTGDMDKEYKLGQVKMVYETVLVLKTPPVERDLDLVDFYRFGMKNVMHVPLQSFSDLVRIYDSVCSEWEYRFKKLGINEQNLEHYPPVTREFGMAKHDSFPDILMLCKMPRLFKGLTWGHPPRRKLWARYKSGQEFVDRRAREKIGIGNPVLGVSVEIGEGDGDGEQVPGKERKCKTIGDLKDDPGVIIVHRLYLGMVLYVHSFFNGDQVETLAEGFREVRLVDEKRFESNDGFKTDYATDVADGYGSTTDGEFAGPRGGDSAIRFGIPGSRPERICIDIPEEVSSAETPVVVPEERVQDDSDDRRAGGGSLQNEEVELECYDDEE